MGIQRFGPQPLGMAALLQGTLRSDSCVCAFLPPQISLASLGWLYGFQGNEKTNKQLQLLLINMHIPRYNEQIQVKTKIEEKKVLIKWRIYK